MRLAALSPPFPPRATPLRLHLPRIWAGLCPTAGALTEPSLSARMYLAPRDSSHLHSSIECCSPLHTRAHAHAHAHTLPHVHHPPAPSPRLVPARMHTTAPSGFPPARILYSPPREGTPSHGGDPTPPRRRRGQGVPRQASSARFTTLRLAASLQLAWDRPRGVGLAAQAARFMRAAARAALQRNCGHGSPRVAHAGSRNSPHMARFRHCITEPRH